MNMSSLFHTDLSNNVGKPRFSVNIFCEQLIQIFV